MTPRTLLVAHGARRGFDLPLDGGCVIGAQAGRCGLTLPDDGVAPHHCALTLDACGRVVCTALDAPVWVGRRELPPGASMAMPDFLPLRCGQATLMVGPQGADWSFAMRAAESSTPGLSHRADQTLRRVRSHGPLAAGALVLGSMLLVAGSVWGAVRWLSVPKDGVSEQLVRTQRWLQSVAPPDSRLQAVLDESRQRVVVVGRVPSESDRAALSAAIARLPDAVHDEVESLAQPPLEVETPKVAGVTTARRFAVLMSSHRSSTLVGSDGQRWREGDAFDGMTIRRIGLDQVVFDRDRHEVVLGLWQLR